MKRGNSSPPGTPSGSRGIPYPILCCCTGTAMLATQAKFAVHDRHLVTDAKKYIEIKQRKPGREAPSRAHRVKARPSDSPGDGGGHHHWRKSAGARGNSRPVGVAPTTQNNPLEGRVVINSRMCGSMGTLKHARRRKRPRRKSRIFGQSTSLNAW